MKPYLLYTVLILVNGQWYCGPVDTNLSFLYQEIKYRSGCGQIVRLALPMIDDKWDERFCKDCGNLIESDCECRFLED